MSSPLEEPRIIKMKNLMRKINREEPELYKKIADVLDKGDNSESIDKIRGVLQRTNYETIYNDLVENVDPAINVTDSEIERIIQNDAPGNDGEHKVFYDKNNRTHVDLIKYNPSKSAQLNSKKKIKETSTMAKQSRKKDRKEKEEELFGSELDFELKGGRRRKSRNNNKSKKSRKSRKQRK